MALMNILAMRKLAKKQEQDRRDEYLKEKESRLFAVKTILNSKEGQFLLDEICSRVGYLEDTFDPECGRRDAYAQGRKSVAIELKKLLEE